MKQNKLRIAALGIGGVSLIVWLGIRVLLFDIDGAVIRYGSQTVRMFNTLALVALIALVLSLVTVLVVQFMTKSQTVAQEKKVIEAKKTDPHFEEAELVGKLNKMTTTEPKYGSEIARSQEMISRINDYIEDLQELQANNEYDILDKIEFSTLQAKTQILQNTKSVINRITVQGDQKEIDKRLETNSEILRQVKGLLNEAVNYLDSKSPSTKADLESMTKALQSLNKTIE